MDPADKKNEAKPENENIASDVAAETTEQVKVVEEAAEEVKPQGSKPEEPAPPADPLTEFKEKMIREEHSDFDVPAKKNYMWPILFIFIIVILLLVGVFFYRHGINTNNNKVNVTKITPSPTVVPAPTKAIDLTKYEIEILNGSSVDGEASKQKTSLEGEGFIISSIGNADNSDYTDTLIKAKANVDKAFLAKLKSVLGSSFTVGETQSLSEDNAVPVVVIIGTKK